MAIQIVDIVGAGTMDNGIAQACAVVELDVVMVDISDTVVQEGIATVAGSLDRSIKKEKLTETDKAAALARIQGSTSYDGFKRADLVIEATTESFDLKVKILKQLEAAAASHAIVASNTSFISITKLAAVLQDASRFISIHFFNPVPMMALVEVVRGLQTSDATHAAVKTLVKQLGKTPITVKNSPGFVINRILCPMTNEAFCMLGEGLASPEEIDESMKLGCNHPIGSLALADMIGLDTILAVMEVLYTEFDDPRYRPAILMREIVATGYLGRKTGRGVYDYRKQTATLHGVCAIR